MSAMVGFTLAIGLFGFVDPALAAPTVTASLVRTVNLFQLNPPSPDPSGIAYLPAQDRLQVADSEVEEMSIWKQVNLWKIRRDGTLEDTANIRPFTKEPTGLGFDPATGRLFISDDSARKIFIVLPGNDGKYGTSDDVRTSFSTLSYGSNDPEDVAFATSTGELFTADGLGAEIYRISPGPNGIFEGTGDDIITHFDVQALGVQDAEGLGYYPARNTLLVPDGRASTTGMIETSLGGTLLTTINISAAQPKHPEDVAVAPGTNGGANNLYMVARGVDNNSNPNENDGKMYEFSVNLPSLGNTPPVVDAGPDQTVQLPNAVSLNGSVSDDGKPTPPSLTSEWSKVSGPGTVAFGNASAPVTTATFSDPGTYVLRLTGNDSELTTSDNITVVASPAGGGSTLNVPIAAGSDDAEEAGGATKTMFLNSSDLEMVRDNGADQTVGLRFAGVAVPPGATITNAYVQFTTQAAPDNVATLTIRGEAADNPGTFTTAVGNISGRTRTSASAGWSPPVWTTPGAAGPDQRTSNLSTIVQELVNRQQWASGNAIVLIITGTGRRVAHTFETGAPAVLHIEFQ